MAQQTDLPKSSVQRLKQAMERRNRYPESWLWETEDGRQWLTRLVVATLYTFGLKRGIGSDTLSEFFTRLHLEAQVGCSPTALRGVMQALGATVLETATAWEQEGRTPGEVGEVIGAVDETFLERMILVCMDLATGYLLLEEVADDRTYITWKTLVDERLTALGASVLYLVSDRAQALIQLAEKGLGCFSMPDFFPVVHEIIKGYSLALGRQLRQAEQDLAEATATLAQLRGRPQMEWAVPVATATGEAKHAAVQHWEEVQRQYRHQLETFSLTLHPFAIADATPQTSAQVERRLSAAVEAIEALATRAPLPARPAALKKVRTQVPALAALVDFWWQGVWRDLEPFALSPDWQHWIQACLLPCVYWEHHAAQTRCARRKAQVVQALEAVRVALERHPITQGLDRQVLAEWYAWARRRVRAFARASSAVEGRNGFLSQLHHNQRGVPTHGYKVWQAVHNFDQRATDGTTPATRFFRRAFPDLFETVLAGIEVLPRARQRQRQVALST
jgi:hypothetical protein